MNLSHLLRIVLISEFWILTSVCFIGCEKPENPAGDTHGSEDHHDHGTEGSGATFQEGKGITLLDETQKAIGLELAEVGEQSVQPTVALTAQVYRSADEASRTHGRERQGNAYATARVSMDLATQLKPSQNFTFVTKTHPDSSHSGTLLRIDRTQEPLLGQAEALLEIPDPDRSLRVGDFLEAQVPLGQAPQKRVSIPRSAVLETSTGTFAFVKNGEALLRTEIKTGVQTKDYTEVTEGLYEGDVVVLKPVETLYLIELRATKGGGHSH